MAVLDAAEDFRIGRVVSRLFNVLLANPVTFLGLAAILSIPNLLVNLFITLYPGVAGMDAAGTPVPGTGMVFLLTMLVQAIVYVVFAYMLQAALVQGTITFLNDERPSFGQCLATGAKMFFPIFLIAILAALGVGLGLVLLVVPGVILALMWAVVIPVCVVEHTGVTDAFGRSRALTEGYRGSIFLLFLMLGLLSIALAFGIRPLLGLPGIAPQPGEASIAFTVVHWLVTVVTTVLTATGVTSIYYELRLVKEGIGAQQMAAAFD